MGLAEHPPACGKWGINSLVCFACPCGFCFKLLLSQPVTSLTLTLRVSPPSHCGDELQARLKPPHQVIKIPKRCNGDVRFVTWFLYGQPETKNGQGHVVLNEGCFCLLVFSTFWNSGLWNERIQCCSKFFLTFMLSPLCLNDEVLIQLLKIICRSPQIKPWSSSTLVSRFTGYFQHLCSIHLFCLCVLL